MAAAVLLWCLDATGIDRTVSFVIELACQHTADDVEGLLLRHPGERQRFDLHVVVAGRLENAAYSWAPSAQVASLTNR